MFDFDTWVDGASAATICRNLRRRRRAARRCILNWRRVGRDAVRDGVGMDSAWLTHIRSALEAANREYRMLTTQVAFFERYLREGDWAAEID